MANTQAKKAASSREEHVVTMYLEETETLGLYRGEVPAAAVTGAGSTLIINPIYPDPKPKTWRERPSQL
jgi:hypothetical protein